MKGVDVSQSNANKAEAAEERTEQTRAFVRTVKAARRRKYTPEEKICVVLEGFRREVTVNDLCRREGIKPHSYYAWTKERLTRDTVRDATRQEIQDLKQENDELKQLVAELSLQMHRLKKNCDPDVGGRRPYQRMSAGEKTAVLARVASSGLPKRQILKEIGVPKSTHYRWLSRTTAATQP